MSSETTAYVAYQDNATRVGSPSPRMLIDKHHATRPGQSDAYAKNISMLSSAMIVTLAQGIPPRAIIYRRDSGAL